MAFEVIFGKSAEPGSWPVAERLLSIDSPSAIEKFLKDIRDDAYSKVVSKADQRKIRELKSERDRALDRNDLDTSFEKCIEIAELSKTFSKSNMIKANYSFVRRGPIVNTVGVDFVLVYLFHCYYGYVSTRFTPLEETNFLRTAIGDSQVPHMTELKLSSLFYELLSISDATCALERMSHVASIDLTLKVIQRMDTKVNSRVFIEFIDKIETNSTLVKLLESPLDFPSMQLFERHFIVNFALAVTSICDLEETGKAAASLRSKKWFATFVTNVAMTAESSDNLMFWMANREGVRYCALLKIVVYPSDPNTQVYCELLDSVEWLSNISATGVLLAIPTMERGMSFTSVAFLGRLQNARMIEKMKDTKGLAKSLDLIHFLSAIDFAEWKNFMLSAESDYTPPVMHETYTLFGLWECLSNILERMMTKLSSQPPPKLCQHLTSFVQVIANILFYAQNINELATNIGGRQSGRNSIWGEIHLMKLFNNCDFIMSTATSPKDLAEMCSTSRVRVICNLIAAIFLSSSPPMDRRPMLAFVTGLIAKLCSSSPPVFLKELMNRPVNTLFWSLIFSERVAHFEFGCQLVAIVVRCAGAKLRREWAVKYRNELRVLAAQYFVTFNKGARSHKDELNLLLAMNGIFRPRAIASFRSILDAVDGQEAKGELALKLMLSKILSTKPPNFIKAARAEDPNEFEKVQTVGSLVAGIFLASLVNELKGNAIFKSIISKEKAGRKALIAEMDRQLNLFCRPKTKR